MLYLNKMSVSYINYHRQPRVQFTSIEAYNKKFNTNVPPNKTFEMNFEQAWKRARKETDPNEFIQHQFDVEEMGYFSDKFKAIKKSAKKGYTKLKRKARDKFLTKKQKEAAHEDDLIKDAEEAKKEKEKREKKAAEEKASQPPEEDPPEEEDEDEEEEEPQQPLKRQDAVSEDVEEAEEKKAEGVSVPNISDFLDDYDEEEDEEEMVEVPTLHEQIDSFIAENAKDSESFKRDRAHVVHFNTGSDNIADRLMKGRDRYMKRLKAYVNGDNTVKVRMMNNKEILVSKLNPCKDSIKELLKTKHGEPRFVRVL